MTKVFKNHKTYLNKKNVFGLDLKYDNFKTIIPAITDTPITKLKIS